MTDSSIAIESFRDYLLLMARSLLAPKMRVKLDASDLVQQTMLDAHNKLDQFEGATNQQLSAWLRQILQNNFLNAVRDLQRDKRDVRRERPIDWNSVVFDSFSRVEQWLAANDLTPSKQVSNQEQVMRLPTALERLPEAQREAIVLYHVQGLRLGEVAKQMQRSESSIGGLLYRGLRGLKQLMQQDV